MKATVLTWDWKEQPDWTTLAQQLRDLSGGTVYLYEVDDTGSDEFAIVLATGQLDEKKVRNLYRSIWESGDEGILEVSD